MNLDLPQCLKTKTTQNDNPLECANTLRVIHALVLYESWSTNKQSSSNDSPLHLILSTEIPNYDLSQLLNDYQHILRVHCSDINQMEIIHQNIILQFGKECDLSTCKKLERNNRQNAESTDINILNGIYTNVNNERDIALQQQLDVIHSYFVHCFQLTRFTVSEENQIEKYNTENGVIKENEEGNETDEMLIKMRKIMKEKQLNRSKFEKRGNSKFVTVIDGTDDTNNNNSDVRVNNNNNSSAGNAPLQMQSPAVFKKNKKFTSQVATENTFADGEYSFSKRFYYWDYFANLNRNDRINGLKIKDWYVPSVYNDFKDELLNNKLCLITLDHWDMENIRSLAHLVTKYILEMKCAVYINGYGIYENDSVQIRHVLAVMFYCNTNKLQFEFIATFCKKTKTETVVLWKERNSQFHWWSKSLREMVECYGLTFQKNDRYYHGISCRLLFNGTVVRMCGPTSTTIALNIAQNFCRDGIVLEVAQYDQHLRHFNCEILSDHTSERERLLMGGQFSVRIKSIIMGGANYGIFLNAITAISEMIKGRKPEQMFTSKITRAFNMLVNNKFNDKNIVDRNRIKFGYIYSVFECCCHHIQKMTIDMDLMTSQYLSIKSRFMNEENTHILLDKMVCLLFPNCEKITIKALTLTEVTFENFVSCVDNISTDVMAAQDFNIYAKSWQVEKKPRLKMVSKLQRIVILDPDIEVDDCQQTIDDFKQRFLELHWNIQYLCDSYIVINRDNEYFKDRVQQKKKDLKKLVNESKPPSPFPTTDNTESDVQSSAVSPEECAAGVNAGTIDEVKVNVDDQKIDEENADISDDDNALDENAFIVFEEADIANDMDETDWINCPEYLQLKCYGFDPIWIKCTLTLYNRNVADSLEYLLSTEYNNSKNAYDAILANDENAFTDDVWKCAMCGFKNRGVQLVCLLCSLGQRSDVIVLKSD